MDQGIHLYVETMTEKLEGDLPCDDLDAKHEEVEQLAIEKYRTHNTYIESDIGKQYFENMTQVRFHCYIEISLSLNSFSLLALYRQEICNKTSEYVLEDHYTAISLLTARHFMSLDT